MTSPRTRLSTSIPFWALVGGSAVATAGGAYLLITKLDTLSTKLLDNTATGVDVYAGQIWAVFGAILVGAGLIGFALALTLGALRSAAPSAAASIIEPPVWEETDVVVTEVVEPEVIEPEVVATEVVEPDATPSR